MLPKKQSEEEELTNTKLWDKVLANQPEQMEQQGGDLLYEYPRKVQALSRSKRRKTSPDSLFTAFMVLYRAISAICQLVLLLM